jgi:hypothetical protein
MLAGSEDLAVGMEQQRQESQLMGLAQFLLDHSHHANLAVDLESWTGHGDMTGGLLMEYLNLPPTCTKNEFGIKICSVTSSISDTYLVNRDV